MVNIISASIEISVLLFTVSYAILFYKQWKTEKINDISRKSQIMFFAANLIQALACFVVDAAIVDEYNSYDFYRSHVEREWPVFIWKAVLIMIIGTPWLGGNPTFYGCSLSKTIQI